MISFAQVHTAQWSDTIPSHNVQFQVGIHLTLFHFNNKCIFGMVDRLIHFSWKNMALGVHFWCTSIFNSLEYIYNISCLGMQTGHDSEWASGWSHRNPLKIELTMNLGYGREVSQIFLYISGDIQLNIGILQVYCVSIVSYCIII